MIHSLCIYNKLLFLTSYQLFSAYWLLTYSLRCLRTSCQPFKLVKERSSNPKASKPIWSDKCVLKCYSVKAGSPGLLIMTPFIIEFTYAVISVSSRQSIGRLSINFRFRKPQSNTPRRRSSRQYSVHYVGRKRERGGENEFRTEVTITALEPGLCSHPRRPLEQPPPSAGRTPEPSLRLAGSTHSSDGAPPPSSRPSTSCQTPFTLIHNKRTQTHILRRAVYPGYLNYFVCDRNREK